MVKFRIYESRVQIPSKILIILNFEYEFFFTKSTVWTQIILRNFNIGNFETIQNFRNINYYLSVRIYLFSFKNFILNNFLELFFGKVDRVMKNRYFQIFEKPSLDPKQFFLQHNSIFLGRSASGPIGTPLFQFYNYYRGI
jgi:hypothetical protein